MLVLMQAQGDLPAALSQEQVVNAAMQQSVQQTVQQAVSAAMQPLEQQLAAMEEQLTTVLHPALHQRGGGHERPRQAA